MIPTSLNPMPMLAEVRTWDIAAAAGILLLAAGIVVALMMSYRRSRAGRAGDPRLTPPEQLERGRQMRGMHGDLERLMVEIEQLSKRLANQLDTKTMAIETLLKQAEQRITELKRLSAGNGQIVDLPSTPLSISASATSAEANRATATPADLPTDPVSRSVYQLADQGLDAPAIARRLNEHVGKIELILALRTA